MLHSRRRSRSSRKHPRRKRLPRKTGRAEGGTAPQSRSPSRRPRSCRCESTRLPSAISRRNALLFSAGTPRSPRLKYLLWPSLSLPLRFYFRADLAPSCYHRLPHRADSCWLFFCFSCFSRRRNRPLPPRPRRPRSAVAWVLLPRPPQRLRAKMARLLLVLLPRPPQFPRSAPPSPPRPVSHREPRRGTCSWSSVRPCSGG
mmetsp:Transcript_26273/g.66270  ORF Transcript_26273/g.66270 Transcript_26273/m.66270 type:complete len:201 (-) Transcript_26273:4992-5594(-)